MQLRLLAVAVFLPILVGIFLQGPEYDESIMMLAVSGHATPSWPQEPVAGAEVQGIFADRTSLASLLAGIRDTDVHPPLHYVAAWLVHLAAGPNLAAQRILSLAALAGCLFLLMNQWRKDVDGDFPSTILFVLLFTLAPASYYAGSTARGYAFVMLFLAAAYVALRRLAESADHARTSDSLGPAALVGGGTGMAILTHYLAAAPAGVLGLTALVVLIRRRNWPGLATLCISAALPALISGWFLMNQLDTRGGYEPAESPGFMLKLLDLTVALFVQVPNEDLPLPEGPISLLIKAVLTGLALIAVAKMMARDRNRFMQLGLPVLIVVLHVLGIAIQQWASGAVLEKPRYLTIVWPFTAIVLAHGILWYRQRSRAGSVIPALYIAASILQVGLALAYTPGATYKYIVEAVDQDPGKALLLVDAGYGRGLPAAISLAALPETRIWIASPETLEAVREQISAGSFDAIHVALSVKESSKKEFEEWADDLAAQPPYVEKQTGFDDYRYLKRQTSGN